MRCIPQVLQVQKANPRLELRLTEHLVLICQTLECRKSFELEQYFIIFRIGFHNAFSLFPWS